MPAVVSNRRSREAPSFPSSTCPSTQAVCCPPSSPPSSEAGPHSYFRHTLLVLLVFDCLFCGLQLRNVVSTPSSSATHWPLESLLLSWWSLWVRTSFHVNIVHPWKPLRIITRVFYSRLHRRKRYVHKDASDRQHHGEILQMHLCKWQLKRKKTQTQKLCLKNDIYVERMSFFLQFGIKNRYRHRSSKFAKREHWMDWAEEKYDVCWEAIRVDKWQNGLKSMLK